MEQTEVLEFEYSCTDASAGEIKHDVSAETGAFECKEYVGPVDTAGVMHSGIIVESAGMEILELAGGSGKEIPGDTEAACNSNSITLDDNVDSGGGGTVPYNTVPVFDKREAFEFGHCAVDSDNPVEMQAAANEQDGGSPTKEGIVRSPPEVHKEEEATISSVEDDKGHFTAPVSSPPLNQEATSIAIMASSQEESFEAPASEKLEGGKFMDATFQELEENRVPEHAYDIDFDIDAHDMPLEESFFDENCIFPALDAEKTDVWHAGVDNVIMEESSAQPHTNEHPEDVDMKSLPEKMKDKPVTMHEPNESVANSEKWVHGTHCQSSCKTVLAEASHGMDEASDFCNRQVQGHEELAGYPRNETGAETLASGVAQDKELASNYSKDEDAQEIQVQYDTDDIFASLANENLETVHDAETCEAKKAEEEVSTKIIVKEINVECTSINMPQEDATVHENVETVHDAETGDAKSPEEEASTEITTKAVHFEPTSINMPKEDDAVHENVETVHDVGISEAKNPEEEVCTEITVKEVNFEPSSINMAQEDAPVHLPKITDDEPVDIPVSDPVTADFDLVARETELHLKSEDSVEGTRLDSCIGQEIVSQDEGRGKGTKEGSSDLIEKDVYRDMKLSGVNADEQLVAIDSSGAVGAVSPTLLMSGNAELEHVPFDSEQAESSSATICREVSIDALTEPLAQEGVSTLEQNAMQDRLAVNNCESQLVMSQVEAGRPHNEPVQHQSDDPVVEIGKSANANDDGVLRARNSDVQGFSEIGDEIMELGKGAEQEGKAWNQEHEQSDTKFVDVFPDSLSERSRSEFKEMEVSGDVVKEGKGSEHAKSQSDEELKQSDGRIVGVFDVDLTEMRKIDVDEISDSGDGVIECTIAVPEEDLVAADGKREEYSLMPLAGTLLPQTESVKESKKKTAEASTHLPSLSVSETNVISGTDDIKRVRVVDGLKDGEKSAPVEEQSAAPLEESSELRRVSAIASSKKQAKKVTSDDKLPKAELSRKFNLGTVKETKENDHVGDYAYAKCQSELGEEASVKKVQKPVKQGFAFGIGDLVWAKVRSHPWWPAQIFDPADASKSARKAKRSGRVLVAFFGDCTFAWLQQSQMIAFRSNFKEKVQQTTMRIFCLAVEEALEELCRRSELGLSCRHFKGSLHSTSSFPDANTGIREGVRNERFKDIRTSVEMFRPKKTLEFIKNVAAAPLGAWSSTLQWAESRGHAYGLRTCMVAMQTSDLAPVLLTPPAELLQGSKLKRSHASLYAEDIADAEHSGKSSKKVKKLKCDKDKKISEFVKDRKDSEGKGLLTKAVSGEEKKQVSLGKVEWANSGMKDSTGIGERNTDRNIIKIKLSRKIQSNHLSSSEKQLDSPSVEEAGSEKNLDDGKETLLAMAGHSGKALKRSSLKEVKISSSSKKVRRQVGEESQNDTSEYGAVKLSLADGFSDMDADAPVRTEADTEDAFDVLPSPLKDRVKKIEGSKTSIVTGAKKEVSVKDNIAGKIESVRKFSKVGDSIRRVASELKGTPVLKVVDDVRYTGPEVKNDSDASPRECRASPMRNKASSKESSEDVSLLQLRRDLDLLSKKAGSGVAKGKTVKVSKKGVQAEVLVEKSSPEWQSVPQKDPRSCVQELALAARKRKSEIVHDEILSKLPRSSSTSGSQRQRHHASKGYITSAEKPGERKSYDKSLLLYSRRLVPSASSMKSSSQHYDEKLSSHAPLGLFMRFPEDFPLPTEAQLKATFIPFGPLQMSATRLYKDSASAQVVFKHGRDAESALKHAKKNPMFGQVAVTYRLRHLSHSTRIEMKTETPSLNKAYSSQVAALRESASSRDKSGGSSASLAKRTGDKEVVSSTILSSTNPDSLSGSEPTGDIQDQMMTLLRQVSVIVNTSPVTSDGP